MKSAEKAWLAIAAYEAVALAKGAGETLSEGLDPYVDNENKFIKYGMRAWIGYTALHLMNVLPPSIDLYHQLTKLKHRE